MKKYTLYIYTIISLLLFVTQVEAVIDIDKINNVSASGYCDGSIDITATGTAGPFTFRWSHDTTVTTEDLTNLCDGIYTVTVTNAFGCETTLTANIAVPMTYGLVTYPPCNNGGFMIGVNGGHAPYVGNWTNNSLSYTTMGSHGVSSNGVPVGTYTLIITDASGQSLNMGTQTINSYTNKPITIAGNVQDACSSQPNTGLIDLTVSGGSTTNGQSPTYGFLWNDGQTTEDISQLLGGGDYTVTVTDANNCQEVMSFHVGFYNGFDLGETMRTSCVDLEDGFLQLNPTGGIKPYTYSWNHHGIPTKITPDKTRIYQLVPNLVHTVTVTDSTGCQQITNFSIPEEPLITTIDADNCREIKTCRWFEDIQDAQWDTGKPETVDKDNCTVTSFCNLTGQNETSTGRTTTIFKQYFPSAVDCFIPSDNLCREMQVCTLYIPSKDKDVIKETSVGIKSVQVLSASTGLAATNFLTSCSPYGNKAYLVELFCGNLASTHSFLKHKCKNCRILPGGPTAPIYEPEPEPEPCIFCLNEPIITNVGPNPFDSYFRINFESPTEKIEISVRNALGQIIYIQDLEPQVGMNSAIIELGNDLVPGMYFVTLKSSNGLEVTERLVHQNGN